MDTQRLESMTGAISAWMRTRRIHTIADWRLRELVVRTARIDPRHAQHAIDALVACGALLRIPARVPATASPGRADTRGWNYRLAPVRREAEPVTVR